MAFKSFQCITKARETGFLGMNQSEKKKRNIFKNESLKKVK